jgi:hypothetical protein
LKPLYRMANASFLYDRADRERLSGNVYGHPKFKDGEPITTSVIVGFDCPNNIVETLNSRYEIENWHRRKEDKDKSFSEDEIEELFKELQTSGRWIPK